MRDTAMYALDLAKRIDPNAIIAGGFARDTFLEKEPNDVDVYLQLDGTTPNVCFEMLRVFARRDGVDVSRVRESRRGRRIDTYGGRRADWGGVVKTIIDRTPVDFILFPREVTTEAVWNTFDLGICMAAIANVNDDVQVDARFNEDYTNSVMTLYLPQIRSIEQRALALEHAVRLKTEKFNDYEIRVNV